MAVDLLLGGNGVIYRQTVPVELKTLPITIFSWANPDAVEFGVISAINRNSGFVDFEHYELSLFDDGTLFAGQTGPGFVTGGSTTTDTYTATAWNAVGGVYQSNSSRTAWLNGVSAVTNTTSVGTPTVDEIQIGARLLFGGSLFRAYNGCLAYTTYWDAALSDAEMIQLANGVLPTRIRPGNIIRYVPFFSSSNSIETQTWDTMTSALIAGPDFTLTVDTGNLSTCGSEPPIISSSSIRSSVKWF